MPSLTQDYSNLLQGLFFCYVLICIEDICKLVGAVLAQNNRKLVSFTRGEGWAEGKEQAIQNLDLKLDLKLNGKTWF